MSFSTIIVLGRYQSTSGPARGTVTFTRSALLRDSSTGELLLPYPVVAHLDSEGVLRIALAANDDPTTTPADSGYIVQEAAGDCTRTYTMSVPYNAPNGTLDLVDVATGSIPGTVSLFAVTGGGGAITPTAITVADPTTMGIGTVAGVPLVVAGALGASNDQGATAVIGCTDPAYSLDGLDVYSGTGSALYGFSTDGCGLTAVSRTSPGVSAASDSGPGLVARTNTGPGVQAESTSGPAVWCQQGWLAIADGPTPATPDSGIVIWSASGVFHWKGPDGVVH